MKKTLALSIAAVLMVLLSGCEYLPFPANVGDLPPGAGGVGPGGALPAGSIGNMSSLRIVIDPGHGGTDYGALGEDSGVRESELNLEVSELLRQKFEDAGATVLMTRETVEVDYSGEAATEKLKDMNNRARAVKDFSPDVLVSVHMNKFADRSVRGAEVFIQQGNARSGQLASILQAELNEAINTKGKRQFHSGDYFMLRIMDIPSVIVECGYLSNASEEKLLQDAAHQQALVDCIYEGVCEYFGIQ